MLELSSHEKNCIKTPTNVYATPYNICNRRAVTIQTNNMDLCGHPRVYAIPYPII